MTRPVGRPPCYTPELGERICELLAQGLSLNRICKMPEFPNISVIWRWQDDYPEFNAKYAKARDAQADYYADEINDIADESTPETVNVNRLRVDARKWTASKLRPRKYGDKLTTESNITAVSMTHEQWLESLK